MLSLGSKDVNQLKEIRAPECIPTPSWYRQSWPYSYYLPIKCLPHMGSWAYNF